MISSLKIKGPDGSLWFTPVTDIALHKANWLAKGTDIDPIYMLSKEVFPEFDQYPHKIVEWAKNEMAASDLNLIKMKDPDPLPKETILAEGVWSYDS